MNPDTCNILREANRITGRLASFTDALREAANAQGDKRVIKLMTDLDEGVHGVGETLLAAADALGCK